MRFPPSCRPGKLILSTSSTIIEDAKRNGDQLVAFFYFDAKDPTKCDLRGLLTSVLFQLCIKSNQCHLFLSQLYTNHNDGTDVPSEATLVACLKRMVELLARDSIYLIIDAVDECSNSTGNPSPREKVLNLLRDLINSQYPNLHICVTSGLDQDIRSFLEPLTNNPLPVSLHEETGHKVDIINYVKSSVRGEDRELRHWSAEDRNQIIESLSERAGGM